MMSLPRRQRTGSLIELLHQQQIRQVTLLVIPGVDWSENDLDTLRGFQHEGCTLAGHGWSHRCPHIKTWGHRIHSLLISRDLGEHLSYSAWGIARRIARCRRWFDNQRLGEPQLYVPPAWAMGSLPRRQLARLPFDLYETLTGVYDASRRAFVRLPLVGYEADTAWRKHCLRLLNGLNIALARRTGKPLRISIHPFDLDYHLADDLRSLIQQPLRCLGYDKIEFG